MKKTTFALVAALAMCLASCGSNPENSVSSTPIDSTNVNGTAPVQYGPVDPASPDSPRYQGAFDTGARANTLSHQDSVNKGLIK